MKTRTLRRGLLSLLAALSLCGLAHWSTFAFGYGMPLGSGPAAHAASPAPARVPDTIEQALTHEPKPAVVQAIANLLDSPGGIRRYADPPRPRDIIATAQAQGVGVMGIRAVQAGALTARFDRTVKATHPDGRDFERAAPYRALCAELGVDPALLAHRYALDIAGVDTVVLGVKNRAELAQCIDAEEQGPLPDDLRARIDGLNLRAPVS